MYGRYKLKDVRFLLENEGKIRSDAAKGLEDISKSIDMEISIRNIFHILEYILVFRDEKYIDAVLLPMIHRINASQIKKENLFEVFYGKYSPVTGYNYIKAEKEYLISNEGAFPTTISRGRVLVYGLYPDIDSTSYSLLIFSKAYKILKKRFKENLIKSLRKGIDYLFKRDINKDGLLEQTANEDWAVKAHREGSITYSNIIYYLAIENLYDLFLSIGDKEYISKLDRKLTKISDAILDKLWVKNYIVDGIDKYGKYDLTYALDTVYITQSHILKKDEKIIKHIKTLAKNLTVNGMLISFSPPSFNSRLEKVEKYTDVNAGVWPRYNIMFARALIDMGYLSEAAKLLKNIFEIKDYKWVNPYDLSIHSSKTYENSILLLIALKEMKEKLEKMDEEGPASTDRE